VNLREQHLSESFTRRIFVPVVTGASRVARRITPIDARDRVARKLLIAGSPAGWDAERLLAFKIIGFSVGIALGLFVTTLIGDLAVFIRIVLIALLAFVGFMIPDSMLSRRVGERQKEILRTLSDTLDLLTISVEAGLSLNAAIAQVVQNVPGVLSSEFARMLQEIQLGVPRADAFRNLAERTDVDELNAFALAMIQADVFGVSIASVLRTQAQQLILCILPALFVVIVGPGAIRIWESFITA
jgi:tight adherence protein C